LFLDIQPEKAQERGGYGGERYEKEDVQTRVREVFERIGNDMNAAHPSGTKWVRVDASDEVDAVAKVLWKNIEPLLEGTELPIQRLWEEKIL
jgi:dTMP kinase